MTPAATMATPAVTPSAIADIGALCGRAQRLEEVGKLAEAIACWSAVLNLDPGHAQTLGCLGVVAARQGRPDLAAAFFRRLTATAPHWAEAHSLLGIFLRDGGRLDEALASCERALEIAPGRAEMHNNLGLTLKAMGRFDTAAVAFCRALELRPDYAEACSNLGVVLKEQKRFEEAETCLRQALVFAPDLPDALNNLGILLMDRGDGAGAETCFRRALAVHPNFPEPYNNLGALLTGLGRFDEALDFCTRALALHPTYAEAHWNVGLIRLVRGELAAGWVKYEWRWWKKDFTHHGLATPPWTGDDLDGRVLLVHTEQGFGDSIQFIRYLPALAAAGRRIVLSCPAALCGLFAGLPGPERVVAKGPVPPAHDCQVPLLSLPYLFGTTLDTIPTVVPYLHADPTRAARWSERLAGLNGRRVGLVWRGNPGHRNDRNRSMSAMTMAPFCALAGISPVVLQKDMTPDEAHDLAAAVSVYDAGPALADWAETAALVSVLDLVISVDTAVAHLAGALGRPVWVLLPATPDWRWLLEREDSPWYPTMRLIRQDTAGDWSGPVAAAVARLAGGPCV